MLDWIVLRAVAGIVGHANLDAQLVDQFLQVGLEDVVRGRVAAARVTEQENGLRIGVALLADALPVPTQTVASEKTGVVAQSKVDVASIPCQVIDAVRDEYAVSPTGEVVVKGFGRLPSPDAALAKQLSKVFFGFAVEGKDGVASIEVFGLQSTDALELSVAVRRYATGKHLVDFA